MIRVCPHSDAACPHGMGCAWSCATDAYDGTKREVSRERTYSQAEVDAILRAAYPRTPADHSPSVLPATPTDDLGDEQRLAELLWFTDPQNYAPAPEYRAAAWAGQREAGAAETANPEAALFARCSQAGDYLDAALGLVAPLEPRAAGGEL